MNVETYFRTIGKFRPTDNSLVIALDYQNIEIDPLDPDNFLTTFVIDVRENSNGYFTGSALITSAEQLKAEGWTAPPGSWHYHYEPVWYDRRKVKWIRGTAPNEPRT